jgi:hypothetical protein
MLQLAISASSSEMCDRRRIRDETSDEAPGASTGRRPMLQRTFAMPDKRKRLLVSAALGLITGAWCWYLMVRLNQGAADFRWAIWLAADLLNGRNPYHRELQLYPLPAALFGLPFVRMAEPIAAGIFYGLSSAALAFGLTRWGYHRLLIFAAYPYWAGMLTVQWMPLIMACAFFYPLWGAILAKPQIGVPIALTRLDRRGLTVSAGVLLVSFLVMPHWVQAWRAELGGYVHFIPLFVFPGMLLAVALLRFRDRDARLLLLSACMPQRWFYDAFILWLIPRSRREIVYTVGLSWIAGIWRWYYAPHYATEVARVMILSMYVPMLVVLFLRKPAQDKQQSPEQPLQKDSGASSTTSEGAGAD